MDQLITKPLKRFVFKCVQISKGGNHFESVKYTADTEKAIINMTEFKPSDKSQTYLETHFDSTIENEFKNGTLNDSIQTKNSLNLLLNDNKTVKFNDIIDSNLSNSDNKAQLVKVKMINSVKETPKIFDLTKNERDQTVQNLDTSKYSCGDVQIENAAHPSVIKIKVKVINKNKKETDCHSDGSDNDNKDEKNNDLTSESNVLTNSELRFQNSTDLNIHDNEVIPAIKSYENNSNLTCPDNIFSNKNHNEDLIENYQNTTCPNFKTKNNDSIIQTTKFIEELPNLVSKKHDVSDTCIFDENKTCPLSPIKKINSRNPYNIDDLIQFHERTIRKSPPKMGTNALISRKSETKLNDSEIISALVHDRFIVNMYESRSFKRGIKKPSTYGRIYKSLERAVMRYESKENLLNNDIVTLKQNSPIKLNDQLISLKTTQKNFSNSSVDQICEDIKNITFSKEETRVENLKTELVIPSSEYGSGSISIKNSTISLEKQSDQGMLDSTFNSDVSSYNMEDFLKKALGDELDTTEIESRSVSSPEKPQEESMCTSNASDLLSKINTLQSTICRSFTKGIQQMTGTLRHTQKSQESSKSDLDSLFSNNEDVAKLLRQAAVQYEALKQISKALVLCRNSKEFSVSSEQVEGERLLLIATYKRQSILDEIRRIEYSTEIEPPVSETGSLTISNITLPLKASTPDGPRGRDLTKWYVVVFSSGVQVTATRATLAAGDGSVKFLEKVVFENLPTHFEVNVEVYCLLQRKSARNFSHESKYHINKDMKKSRCPTPKKMLSREKSIPKLPARYETGIRTSSFKLCGSLKLTIGDLTKSGPWSLKGKISLCSSLSGAIILNLNSTVQIPIKESGFLTLGSGSGGCVSWNRRWCVLEGNVIRYWNYPSEEETSNPIREIDLKYCVSSSIRIADRSLCARPRTLLLEIARKPRPEDSSSLMLSCNESFTIERYYLSADNIANLNIWQQQLDKVVHALRIWNVEFLA